MSCQHPPSQWKTKPHQIDHLMEFFVCGCCGEVLGSRLNEAGRRWKAACERAIGESGEAGDDGESQCREARGEDA